MIYLGETIVGAHWREQLQPVVQFRTHYKFGSHQPPVEINFEQGGTVQPTHTTKTDGRAEYNYTPSQRSRLRQGTSETHEQSETDGKPTRSGTATRFGVTDRKVYLKTDNAYDCIPRCNGIRRPTSSISGDSDSDDDRMPPLRRQNAIRRRRSPTPARPKSQPGILTTQQERLIALVAAFGAGLAVCTCYLLQKLVSCWVPTLLLREPVR